MGVNNPTPAAPAGVAPYKTLVTLGSDVSNATTSLADITGLSFPVLAGVVYRWYADIIFTIGSTTHGTKWAITGPASPTFNAYGVRVWLSGSTVSDAVSGTYDALSSISGSFSAAGTPCEMWGIIKPSVNGIVQLRFGANSAGQTPVIKAGSTLEYW